MTARPGDAAAGGEARLQKAAFGTLILAHAFNDLSGGFFSPLAPLIVEEFGLSLTLIGVIMTTRGIFGSVPQPFFGWMIDRFPSRWWLLSTPLWVGGCRSLIGFASGFWSLTGLLSLGALGGACFHPAAAARTREVSGRRRGLVMAGYIAAGRVGHATGPIIALTLVSGFGLRGLALAISLYAVSIAALHRFLPARTAARTRGPGEGRPALERHNWRPMLLLYATSILRNMVTANISAFLPLYLASRGLSLWSGGTALTLFLLSGGVGGLCGGWLSDRVGRKKVLVLSALLTIPILLTFLRAGGGLQLLLILPLGITVHGAMGVSVAYAQELLPGRPALAASFMQGGNWFVAGLSLSAMGAIGDLIGLQTALHILAGLLSLEFCLALFLPGWRIAREGRGLPLAGMVPPDPEATPKHRRDAP